MKIIPHDKLVAMPEAQWRELVYGMLRDGEERFRLGQLAIAENTALTKTVVENTAEMIEIFQVSKRGVSFFRAVGKGANRLARWMLPIVTAAGIMYAVSKGQWPTRWGE